MLIGQGNKFELWNEERWNQNCDNWLSSDEPDDAEESTELKSLTL
jgi:MraZ protein